MKPVTSSAIAALGYDAETRTTGVQFHSGPKIYEFPEMSAEAHAAFASAESVGAHYHAHVKSRARPKAA